MAKLLMMSIELQRKDCIIIELNELHEILSRESLQLREEIAFKDAELAKVRGNV